MPANNKEQDIERIGAATGSEVSKLARAGAVSSSPDLAAHLLTFLRSSQRPGHLIFCRVRSGFSAGLRGAIADPAAAMESDKIVDESSRMPSQRVGVDDYRVTITDHALHKQTEECGVPTVTVLYSCTDMERLVESSNIASPYQTT